MADELCLMVVAREMLSVASLSAREGGVSDAMKATKVVAPSSVERLCAGCCGEGANITRQFAIIGGCPLDRRQV